VFNRVLLSEQRLALTYLIFSNDSRGIRDLSLRKPIEALPFGHDDEVRLRIEDASSTHHGFGIGMLPTAVSTSLLFNVSSSKKSHFRVCVLALLLLLCTVLLLCHKCLRFVEKSSSLINGVPWELSERWSLVVLSPLALLSLLISRRALERPDHFGQLCGNGQQRHFAPTPPNHLKTNREAASRPYPSRLDRVL
jgi:hypothetical protein